MKHILAISQIVWLELIRKKDLYVLFILLASLLLTLVSLNIFDIGSSTNYVKDIGLMMIWLFGWILAVSITARQLPTEESRRTIYPLLAKPLTRLELVLGKWLGAWSLVAAATGAFYILTALVVLGMGGQFAIGPLTQSFILHALALAVICALALAFSTRMNSDAACTLTYVVSGASFILVPRVPTLMTRQTGLRSDLLLALYNVLPHLEVLDMRRRVVHNHGMMPAAPFALALCYGCVLTASVLLLAWLLYRHKNFSRGKAM